MRLPFDVRFSRSAWTRLSPRTSFILAILAFAGILGLISWNIWIGNKTPRIQIKVNPGWDNSAQVTIQNTTDKKILLRTGVGMFGSIRLVYFTVEKRTKTGWQLEAGGRDTSENLYAFSDINVLAPGEVAKGVLNFPANNEVRRIVIYARRPPTRWPHFLSRAQNYWWKKYGMRPDTYTRFESAEIKVEQQTYDGGLAASKNRMEFEAASRRIHANDSNVSIRPFGSPWK